MDEQQTSGEVSAMPAPSDVVVEPVVNVPPDAVVSDAPTPAPDPVSAVTDTLPPDPVSDNTTIPPAPTAETAPVEPETVPTVPDVVLEPIVTAPAPIVEPTPELPVIQVDPAPHVVVPSSEPEKSAPEVRIVERVVEKVIEKEVIKEVPVEKIVEREVIKEVPVEKIVEKIVYRDPAPLVCPPPTQEEREAIERDFMIELSHEGTARKHALVVEKLDAILSLFETRDRIMHKDVMDALACSGTTATRLLTELRHEGKLFLHGTGGNGATYTKI